MVSDEQLIDDLKEFATELGETPTAQQMRESGPRSAGSYTYHFNSWNDALQCAELEINRVRNSVEGKEQLIEDLQKFSEEIDGVPTYNKMNNSGPWNAITYERNFGNWNSALEAAGLEPNRKCSFTKEQLIENLKEFAEELDRTPTQRDMNNSGAWSHQPYVNHFGTWNDALQEAGLEINRLSVEERAGTGEEYMGEDYKQKRSETLERDKYICRVCETTDGLNCHHIKPRREFEKIGKSNTLDNLITLCNSCHGTFEGRWRSADPDEFEQRAKEYR